jgi:hypothetical protein
MNCFNIRELQGILKRKFFTDLVNTSDSHTATEATLINMRHKNNMSNILLYDQSLFYNFDLTNTSKFKNFTFTPGQLYTYSNLNTSPLYSKITNIFPTLNLTNYFKLLPNVLKDLTSFVTIPSFITCTTMVNSFFYLKTTISNSVYVNLPNLYQTNTLFGNYMSTELAPNKTVYSSSTLNYSTFTNLLPSSFSENSSTWRFNRYSYPLISYDYKTGNYLSIWDQLYPSLSLSFIEVARGVRKAPWFFSDQYTDLLKNNYNTFINKFTTQLNLKLADIDSWNSVHISPINSFLSIFFNFSKNDTFVNLRFISINALDQKLYSMFNSSSIQQRILAN